MVFEVNVGKLIDNSLNINDYLFCQFIYTQNKKLFDFYLEQFDKFFTRDSLDNLVKRNYIVLENPDKGYAFTNMSVSELFLETFKDDLVLKKAIKVESNTLEWFDEWYSLWPKGIKSGGYPVKGDRKGCIKKLLQFIKEYPEFNKEIILAATRGYINESRKNRFAYIKLAHFFIYKDKMSVLSSYCELVKEKVDSGEYNLKDSVEGGSMESGNQLNYDNVNDI